LAALLFSAQDVCKGQLRSIMTGDDVLAAVEELEFDMFLDPLQAYLKGATGSRQQAGRQRGQRRRSA